VKYEVTIEKHFSAGHALRLPNGDLEPMHGHDWPVAVTVGSPRLDAMDTVMDFHVLEALVEAVLRPWHNRVLNEVPPFAGSDGTLVINVSAERVAEQVALAVAAGLPEDVTLLKVSVGEAPGCLALYRP